MKSRPPTQHAPDASNAAPAPQHSPVSDTGPAQLAACWHPVPVYPLSQLQAPDTQLPWLEHVVAGSQVCTDAAGHAGHGWDSSVGNATPAATHDAVGTTVVTAAPVLMSTATQATVRLDVPLQEAHVDQSDTFATYDTHGMTLQACDVGGGGPAVAQSTAGDDDTAPELASTHWTVRVVTPVVPHSALHDDHDDDTCHKCDVVQGSGLHTTDCAGGVSGAHLLPMTGVWDWMSTHSTSCATTPPPHDTGHDSRSLLVDTSHWYCWDDDGEIVGDTVGVIVTEGVSVGDVVLEDVGALVVDVDAEPVFDGNAVLVPLTDSVVDGE